MKPNEIVFLRGAQEEMFLKLMQLQTAPNPEDIVSWMFDHGVDKTIHSYGLDSSDLLKISNKFSIPFPWIDNELNIWRFLSKLINPLSLRGLLSIII